MDRALRFLFWIFVLSFLFILRPAEFAKASSPRDTELESILRKIESRHYRWVAIRANVLLFFAVAGDSRAMCGGELLYQRLEERMLFSCVDAQKELVFAFRTFDRHFDLYIPSQNTVYHGSIFDMEDSPNIESHLKARDLYRALKPLAVDPRRAKLDRANSLVTSIDVYGRGDAQGALLRKLYLTPEGDVRGELFYNSAGRAATEIQRYDFQKLPGRAGSFDSVIFPKKITILSPETRKGSALFFTRVKALDTIDPLEFFLRVSYGTREIFLDEKDPLYQRPQKPAPEILSSPKNTRSAALKSLSKNPPGGTKATLTPAAPAVKKELSAKEEVTPSPMGLPPTGANIIVKKPVSEDADPNTTLDPSVEPSLKREN